MVCLAAARECRRRPFVVRRRGPRIKEKNRVQRNNIVEGENLLPERQNVRAFPPDMYVGARCMFTTPAHIWC